MTRIHSINKVHLCKTICFEEVCDNVKKSTHFHFNNSLINTTQFHATYGSIMPGLYFASGTGYRYGFNTQLKDDEISGNGNHTTALFWEYDTRLGRRWNVDPVVKVWESSYLCFAGNPLYYKDINGDDVAYKSKNDRKAVRWLKRHDDNFKQKFKDWKSDKGTLYVFHMTKGIEVKGVDLNNAEPKQLWANGKEITNNSSTRKERNYDIEDIYHIHYDQATYTEQSVQWQPVFKWNSDEVNSNSYKTIDGKLERTIQVPDYPYDPNNERIKSSTNPKIVINPTYTDAVFEGNTYVGKFWNSGHSAGLGSKIVLTNTITEAEINARMISIDSRPAGVKLDLVIERKTIINSTYKMGKDFKSSILIN